MKPSRPPLLPLAVLVGALVLATTGGAVAGSMITGRQIKNNTVTSADVRDGNLRRADLSPDALVPGPAGPAGPAGADGSQGPEGPAGTSTLYRTRMTGRLVVNQGQHVLVAQLQLPPGVHALTATFQLRYEGGAQDWPASCSLGTGFNVTSGSVDFSGTAGGMTTMPMTLTRVLEVEEGSGPAELRCRAGAASLPGDVSVNGVELWAAQADILVQQP